MVREPCELIRREIAGARHRTNRAFGVNLIPAAIDPGLLTEQLKTCKDEGIETLAFFWDVMPDAVARASDLGMRVIYQVGSVGQARAAEAAGAVAIIAQGVEADGHMHGTVSSLVLVPQVAAATDLPVIASGGFATGRSLVAAMALGAQGIHSGTAFLAATESFAHDLHKQRVVEAASDETVHTDAFVINLPKGVAIRFLRSAVTDSLGDRLFGHDREKIPRHRIADEDGKPIYRWSTDPPLPISWQISSRRPAHRLPGSAGTDGCNARQGLSASVIGQTAWISAAPMRLHDLRVAYQTHPQMGRRRSHGASAAGGVAD